MPSTTFFNLPQQKRDKLLEAARAEFARVPFGEASINRMIQEAEIPRGSFYMYFTDKEDIFRYLILRVLEQFNHIMAQVIDQQKGDLFAGFLDFFDALVRRRDTPQFQQTLQMLCLNGGVHQGVLLRSLGEEAILDVLRTHCDHSLLMVDGEEELNQALSMLLFVAFPCVGEALMGGDPIMCRITLETRFRILKRGIVAPSTYKATAKEST